ncbi:DNA-directed RNA polymerase specialized sigma subunit, sigma24 family [Amycolatopsis xylanica]|uniref:DNA-directed RNA polymerase specialized sigma subunit, sigma24 family n=1 Tax=Amycolatopsis xylanica TaxID=589385 RepID=A0A1H3EAI8_9PSEU|nr:sigma factor-like helix-turn-helix DNA-binding protein [Amycolatopsis xylanica]SDX75726.1 DNA-directed RNA polymerase specialized sigma subunit, sigma24 family [Amycolatopsis xylanica]
MKGKDDFSEFFAARAQRYRRLAYALTGDWPAADTLVETMFVRLHSRWRKVRPATADEHARKLLLDAYFSKRHQAKPPDQAAPGMDRVLAGLAPRQRAMVVLHFLEDLPVPEVAALAGVPVRTAETQIADAVAALRDSVQPSKE